MSHLLIDTIIIEDEPRLADTLVNMLQQYHAEINIQAVIPSIRKGIQAIDTIKPDLVFLDIQLEDGTGFELLQQYPNRPFIVVFLTAYSQYAIQAIKAGALDYILKPVDVEELNQTVIKIKEELKIRRSHEEQIQAIRKLTIPTEGNFEMVEHQEITYLEADGAYTLVHLSNGKTLMASKNLKVLLTQLPESIFFRCHYSYVINLEKVVKYLRNSGHKVELEGGVILEIARRRIEEFQQKFKPGT